METPAARPNDYVDPNYGAPEDPVDTFARLRTCPTDLPVFNQLLDVVEDYLEGAATLETVESGMTQVDAALGYLRLEFESGVRYQEESDELEGNEGVVWAMLYLLQQEFANLRVSLPEKQAHDVAHSFQECNAAINQLFWAFQALKQISKTDEFSESPYVNEVIRVGRAFMRKTLPLEAFQERFEAFYKFHFDFVGRLAEVQTDKPGQLQEIAAITPLLEQQSEALEEVALFFEDQEEQHIERGLDKLQKNTVLLMEAQRSLQANAHSDVRVCLACGHENVLDARFCVECKEKLVDPRAATVVHTDAPRGGPPPLSANIQRLFDAATELREKKITTQEFSTVVDWFETLLEGVIKHFGDMPEPDQETVPEDQWEVYEKSVTTMEEALSQFRAAVQQLRQHIHSGNRQDLDMGLEKVLEATDTFEEMNYLSQQAMGFTSEN